MFFFIIINGNWTFSNPYKTVEIGMTAALLFEFLYTTSYNKIQCCLYFRLFFTFIFFQIQLTVTKRLSVSYVILFQNLDKHHYLRYPSKHVLPNLESSVCLFVNQLTSLRISCIFYIYILWQSDRVTSLNILKQSSFPSVPMYA